MNILIACDSFKDALAADAVCRAIAAGLKKSHPGARVTEMPLSDGGEGLLDVLRAPLVLNWIECEVADPLETEHRVIDEEGNHDAVVRRIRRCRRNP